MCTASRHPEKSIIIMTVAISIVKLTQQHNHTLLSEWWRHDTPNMAI